MYLAENFVTLFIVWISFFFFSFLNRLGSTQILSITKNFILVTKIPNIFFLKTFQWPFFDENTKQWCSFIIFTSILSDQAIQVGGHLWDKGTKYSVSLLSSIFRNFRNLSHFWMKLRLNQGESLKEHKLMRIAECGTQ